MVSTIEIPSPARRSVDSNRCLTLARSVEQTA
jgi:hypothetical protein